MNLVNGCVMSLERELTADDLVRLDRHFTKWHNFLRREIDYGRINERVFTVNNHYLSHIRYIIEHMGPLRFISCRTSERNIKKYTNMIKSVVKPGANASNILINEQSLQSYGLQQIVSSIHRTTGQRYTAESFLVDPNDRDNGAQLWEPRAYYQALGNGRICAGLADADVFRALLSYYRRLAGNRSLASINSDIKIAERLWLNSIIVSSKLYRTRSRQTTRADNFVMFESGRYRSQSYP
ncbi:hypothetical protein G6F67_009424 [Rhizopus microsporus]|nr:hypothetical protein G6F67_009424 [Rhizopus microsporus]